MINNKRHVTTKWFKELRDKLCHSFEGIEYDFAKTNCLKSKNFERKKWQRPGGGGGEISIMKGDVFEKVGVNISTVEGEFSPEFRKQIPGAQEIPYFFATGISVVAHMCSPLIPAVHFNTRYIETTKSWFGGGSDLTPTFEDTVDKAQFHYAFKNACDQHDTTYYPKFSKECDEYFYLKHRNEPRGIGGIFYDYLNSGDFNKDFAFTKDIGKTFLNIFSKIVSNKINLTWTNEEKEAQLIKRGRYVEFNLLYDRGTKFGLMTDGNVEAILMSMPPVAKWV